MMNLENRLKTKSKNFYDDEIQAILANGDIVLKEGVHRLKYNSHKDPSLFSQINQSLIQIEKFEKFKEEHGLANDELYNEL